MELWQKQLIRRLFHYSAKRMDIEGAFHVKHPHVPDRLYKYRQFTQNHLGALKKDVLWMSSPDRLNDPYEAAVYFDTERFMVEDQQPQEFIDSMKGKGSIAETDDIWKPERLVRPISGGEWRRRTITKLLKGVDIPNKKIFKEFIEEYTRKMSDENTKRFSDALRQGFSVLSLSENLFSVLMWSHYSDSHRGFAIEYDFSSLTYSDLRRRLCFPVFYTKKLRDATRYLGQRDTTDFNNLFGQLMCLMKQIEWSYEREWRIIHAIGPSHANVEVSMPVPSTIILGAHVEKVNEDLMRDWCCTRSISLKRMVKKPGSFDLFLENVSLS